MSARAPAAASRTRSSIEGEEVDGAAAPLAGPDQLKVHTWYVLNRAAQRLRELVEGALLPLGLRRRHYAALSVISAEGPLTQRDLSSRIPIDRVAMVSVIDDLEATGLAERQPYPGDRRAYALTLTAKGDGILRKARTLVEAADARGLAPLTPEEKAQLDRLARRLCGWDEAPDVPVKPPVRRSGPRRVV